MGLLWREYPRRKLSLERPKGMFLRVWQGTGKMHAQVLKLQQKRGLRSTLFQLAQHPLGSRPSPFVPQRGSGWGGEEAGDGGPTLVPVYMAPALCWMQVSGRASLTRALPGEKPSTWMSSSRCRWT